MLTEIADVKLPSQRPGIPKTPGQQGLGGVGVWRQIAEFRSVPERKGQRCGRVVEAVECDRRRPAAVKRFEHRNGIGGSAQPDIPDDERLPRFRRPLDEPLLPDVEFDRLGHWPDDGMERLAKFPRAQAARAGLDGDEFKPRVIFARHARTVMRRPGNPQWLC